MMNDLPDDIKEAGSIFQYKVTEQNLSHVHTRYMTLTGEL